VQALFFFVDDDNVARKVAEKAPIDRSIVGNAEVMIQSIARYRDLGFDEIIVPDFVLGDSAEVRRESYERFARDVIPAFC
jgi:alkanesulfonate monooxygenase SsuD/methylene tetrahydromethanopterin reductase-like flavin-dependent oxidoreductase (luciferase family)